MKYSFLYLVYGVKHATLQLQEPLFHLSTSFRSRDDLHQLHLLPFAAPHMSDVQNVSEHDASNALKTLLQVGLHSEIQSQYMRSQYTVSKQPHTQTANAHVHRLPLTSGMYSQIIELPLRTG